MGRYEKREAVGAMLRMLASKDVAGFGVTCMGKRIADGRPECDLHLIAMTLVAVQFAGYYCCSVQSVLGQGDSALCSIYTDERSEHIVKWTQDKCRMQPMSPMQLPAAHSWCSKNVHQHMSDLRLVIHSQNSTWGMQVKYRLTRVTGDHVTPAAQEKQARFMTEVSPPSIPACMLNLHMTSYLPMQAFGLHEGAKQGGSPLVVGGFISPEVGLVGCPVDGVQLGAEGGLQALECPLPLLHSWALCLPALSALSPAPPGPSILSKMM